MNERLKLLPPELRRGAYQSDLHGLGRPLLATASPQIMVVYFAGCVDEQGRLIPGHAATWATRFDTYTEVSGAGIMLWFYASHNLGGATERTQTLEDGSVVVVYRSHPFLPLTGRRLTRFSAITEHCDQTLNNLYRELFVAEEVPASKPSPPRWREQPYIKSPVIQPPPALPLPSMPRTKKRKKEKLRIDEAKDFLHSQLRNCARPAKRMMAEAKDRSIAPRTLQRAKAAMGVKSTHRRFKGIWLWTIFPLTKRGKS